MKVLALDYGARRTGVAVSDATGTLARPLTVVENAATTGGLDEIAALARRNEATLVLVGLPLTLRGRRGEQARATDEFVEALRARVGLPVETFDERFTTALARQGRSTAPEDALAAAHLLQSWLDRRARA